MEAKYEKLTSWLKSNPLRDLIENAKISQQLENSPAALIASQYGWSGNMERIMKAQAYNTGNDASSDYYSKQKKTMILNPRHPLISVSIFEPLRYACCIKGTPTSEFSVSDLWFLGWTVM